MAASKQVMDVSKPGNNPPDPTARPVIVGHGPMMKDPMMHEEIHTNDLDLDESAKDEKRRDILSEPASEKVLQPASAITDIVEAEVSDLEDTKENKDVETKAITTPGVPEAQNTENSGDDSSDEAVVDAVVGQVGQKRHSKELSDAEKADQERIQQLITDKTYFVPIGQVSRHRNRRILLILLLVILSILVAINFALDAVLFDISGVPRTDVL